MLLRPLSNVLGVLQGLLHLIENKIYEEIVINIPIYTSGNSGINEVASKWKRNFLGAYISTLSKIHGNGHWLSILWAKLISISILSIKKKQN